jgi:hypothetical protein
MKKLFLLISLYTTSCCAEEASFFERIKFIHNEAKIKLFRHNMMIQSVEFNKHYANKLAPKVVSAYNAAFFSDEHLLQLLENDPEALKILTSIHVDAIPTPLQLAHEIRDYECLNEKSYPSNECNAAKTVVLALEKLCAALKKSSKSS